MHVFTLCRLSLFHLALGSLPSICSFAAGADQQALSNPSSMRLVSGTVHFGEQKAKMSYLYFRRKDSEEGPLLVLLFSDHTLPLRVLDNRQKLADLARKRTFLGLYVELSKDGSVHQTDLLHDDGGFTGGWTFEPPAGKSENTAGHIATDGEKEFFGKPYAVDVTYTLTTEADQTWRGSPFYETKSTGLTLGVAEGAMELHGKTSKLTHALAVSETDLFGESAERKLFFTQQPITDEILRAPLGPEEGLQKAGLTYLRVTIDSKGEIQSVMAPSEDGRSVNVSSTEWSSELVSAAAAELDGNVALAGSSSGNSDFPRFELRFHAATRNIGTVIPVTTENGKPLPKDGGAPGKVYQDFALALKKAKTIDELLPLRTKAANAMLESVPKEHRAGILEMFKQQGTIRTKIVGGFANQTQATLWTESNQGGEKLEGRVNVQFEDGAWKLGQEMFRSAPSSE
jgi:hypothetical protein